MKVSRKEITIQPILWNSYTSKDGKHPIKLKVTANRRTKNYCIKLDNKNIFLTPKESDDVLLNPYPKGRSRLIKESIEKFKSKALEAAELITKGGRPFSHERFENELFATPITTSFLDSFNKYLDNLLNEGRIGTYRSYRNAYDALVLYLNKKGIKKGEFSAYDLTFECLKDIEKFLLQKRGRITLGIYARTFRTIYNYCASQDYQLKELYPFGRGPGKYKIQSSRKSSKRGDAMTSDELKKFILTDPDPQTPQYKAKLIWLFSFYCQGMNFRDVCLLKYSNFKGQSLQYIREKTKRSEQEVIEIAISDPIRDIIAKIGNPDKSLDAYVFGLLPVDVLDPIQLEPLILQANKTTNKWLKRLCQAHGLPPITTYWSRHTYASLLKFSGVSVDLIRELLGHSDVRTTEHYLKKFDLEVRKEINSRLYDQIMSKAS
jgi:integrase/recombinase XerD